MGSHLSVCVVGLGYIGLPTAVVLAVHGLRVHGVDVKPHAVEAVNEGRVPFVEAGLAESLARAKSSGLLTASDRPEPSDAYIIAVPTPFLDERQPDMSFVEAAVEAIAPLLRDDDLVILESTSPPGSSRRIAEQIARLRTDLVAAGARVHVAYCPERVLPGNIMKELLANDRIIGGLTGAASTRAARVYASFCEGELLITTAETAEMVKLAENSFRDVNIAFANELSLISETVGVNVWELIRLANHHPRVDILQPGPGVGGHCIAVDPWFLVAADPANSRLIRSAREVNDDKPEHVLDQITASVEGVSQPVIAALGLAFKPDIDDLRESPARQIVGRLARDLPHATVRVVEPHISALPSELADCRNVRLTTMEDALNGADCVALLVNHRVFGAQAPSLDGAVLIDTRGAWTSPAHRPAVRVGDDRALHVARELRTAAV